MPCPRRPSLPTSPSSPPWPSSSPPPRLRGPGLLHPSPPPGHRPRRRHPPHGGLRVQRSQPRVHHQGRGLPTLAELAEKIRQGRTNSRTIDPRRRRASTRSRGQEAAPPKPAEGWPPSFNSSRATINSPKVLAAVDALARARASTSSSPTPRRPHPPQRPIAENRRRIEARSVLSPRPPSTSPTPRHIEQRLRRRPPVRSPPPHPPATRESGRHAPGPADVPLSASLARPGRRRLARLHPQHRFARRWPPPPPPPPSSHAPSPSPTSSDFDPLPAPPPHRLDADPPPSARLLRAPATPALLASTPPSSSPAPHPPSASVGPRCVRRASIAEHAVLVACGLRRRRRRRRRTTLHPGASSNAPWAAAASSTRASPSPTASAAPPSRQGPQIGNVVIEDDVEIANACIDRAPSAAPHRRGHQDRQPVRSGNNCRAGRHCASAARRLAGSVTLSDQVMLGGKVGVADNIEIGDRAKVAPPPASSRPRRRRSAMYAPPGPPAMARILVGMRACQTRLRHHRSCPRPHRDPRRPPPPPRRAPDPLPGRVFRQARLRFPPPPSASARRRRSRRITPRSSPPTPPKGRAAGRPHPQHHPAPGRAPGRGTHPLPPSSTPLACAGLHLGRHLASKAARNSHPRRLGLPFHALRPLAPAAAVTPITLSTLSPRGDALSAEPFDSIDYLPHTALPHHSCPSTPPAAHPHDTPPHRLAPFLAGPTPARRPVHPPLPPRHAVIADDGSPIGQPGAPDNPPATNLDLIGDLAGAARSTRPRSPRRARPHPPLGAPPKSPE